MKMRNEGRSALSAGGKASFGASSLGLRAGGDVPIRAVSERPIVLKDLLADVPEEAMIVDERSRQTPAQMVETKLLSRLRDSSLPVSHLQMRGLLRYRRES